MEQVLEKIVEGNLRSDANRCFYSNWRKGAALAIAGAGLRLFISDEGTVGQLSLLLYAGSLYYGMKGAIYGSNLSNEAIFGKSRLH